jgi:hypothetical protein
MPARKKPDDYVEPLKARIQCRLHSDNPDGGREKDALEFYLGDELKKKRWDDRRIVTEALLALRMYWNEGYRPPDNPQAQMTSEILAMLKEAREAFHMVSQQIEMLNSLDLTSLRSQPGWKEDVWTKSSLAVNSGAAAIMGHGKSYDEDEDDE